MDPKIIVTNRKAYHDYYIEDTVEAGLVLTGTEIKSIRQGRVNIRDAYARPENGELWLVNAHIAPYKEGNRYNHDPTRPRKLLLHKDEIIDFSNKISKKGLTIVPLKLYLKKGFAKVELGLARGKKLHDKRKAIIQHQTERELAEALKPGSRKSTKTKERR